MLAGRDRPRAVTSPSVLDLLNSLSRKKWPWVVVAVMIVLALLLSRVGGDSGSSPSTTTESAFVGGTTTVAGAAPGTTGPTLEIDRAGDPPNPGALDPKRPDIRPKDQERQYGAQQEPARLSGYSAWVADVSVLTSYAGKQGPFLRVVVHVVNRDDSPQSYRDNQWTLLKDDGTTVNTSFATPAWVTGGSIPGNGVVDGELYFSAPTSGRYFVLFRPDSESSRGVWGLNVNITG
jgi:Domain of unknown function (DUF4352)